MKSGFLMQAPRMRWQMANVFCRQGRQFLASFVFCALCMIIAEASSIGSSLPRTAVLWQLMTFAEIVPIRRANGLGGKLSQIVLGHAQIALCHAMPERNPEFA
jgi:hypothetical protein